jgi:hypothetical protein
MAHATDHKPLNVMENFIRTVHKYSFNKSVKPGSSFTAPVRPWNQVRQQTRFRKLSLILVETCLCSAKLRNVGDTAVPCIFEAF